MTVTATRPTMPYDCDSYWRPDPVKDAAIWPVPLARQIPAALAALAGLLILVLVLA